MTQGTVVLAAGGTGGHIFPAQALADALVAAGYRVILITDKRFEKYTSDFRNVEIRIIRSGTMRGGVASRLLNVLNILTGIGQAWCYIRELKPAAVVGFGGYPSFPTMVAGIISRRYTVIHEQNSVLGRANRMLAKWVSTLATSFVHTSHIPEECRDKVKFTGNPVRQGVLDVQNKPYPKVEEGGNLHLLIMGGSQGATVFSRVVPAAVELLPQDLRQRLRIAQQCREADLAQVEAKYKQLAVSAECAPFFKDVPQRLERAHAVISRAGASTVAELLVAARPAVLVPYPQAMDDHQRYNANAVEDAGAGWLMPEDGFTPEALADKLQQFLALPSRLEGASEAARKASHPQAAAILAKVVLQQPEGLCNLPHEGRETMAGNSTPAPRHESKEDSLP